MRRVRRRLGRAMSHTRIFRSFLLSDALLTTAVVLTSVFRTTGTPDASEPGSTVQMALELVVLVAWIAALIGLWRFRAWARIAYLTVTAIGLLGALLIGGAERTSIEAALNAACWLVAGAIIALAYWSPLDAAFRRNARARHAH
jgi:hypothetical protein